MVKCLYCFARYVDVCMYAYVQSRALADVITEVSKVAVCLCAFVWFVLCDGYYPLCTVVLYTCDSKFQYGVKCQMHTQHSMTGTLYSDQ